VCEGEGDTEGGVAWDWKPKWMTKEVVTTEDEEGSFGDQVGDIQRSFICAPSQVVNLLTTPTALAQFVDSTGYGEPA